MSFNSIIFAIFLSIVFLLYWSVPKKYQWIILLISSYYFYMSWNALYVFLILFTTGVSYGCGWLLAEVQAMQKKTFIYHNIFSHERFSLDYFLTKTVLKHDDGFIVHLESDGRDLMTIKKNADFRYKPHPTYNTFKVCNLTIQQARGNYIYLMTRKYCFMDTS